MLLFAPSRRAWLGAQVPLHVPVSATLLQEQVSWQEDVIRPVRPSLDPGGHTVLHSTSALNKPVFAGGLRGADTG